MSFNDAIVFVEAVRCEVVSLVGICGYGTHPLTEILDALSEEKIDPELAVVQAFAVRDRVSDFR